MSGRRFNRNRSVCQCALRFAAVVALVLVLGAAVSRASDSEPPMESWRIWLEPGFMRVPVRTPFAGAKRTDVTGGVWNGEQLKVFTKDDFFQIGLDWTAYESLAKWNAAADFPRLRYSFERDRRKTITYARIESEDPVVASAVLVPGFIELFESTIGEKILVVVPNRYTAILFPRLVNDYLDYAPMISRLYEETPYPVSKELFEVSGGKWRCIGSYDPD